MSYTWYYTSYIGGGCWFGTWGLLYCFYMCKKAAIYIGLSSSSGVESRIRIKIEYRLVYCLLQLGTFFVAFVRYSMQLADLLMEMHNVALSLLVKP